MPALPSLLAVRYRGGIALISTLALIGLSSLTLISAGLWAWSAHLQTQEHLYQLISGAGYQIAAGESYPEAQARVIAEGRKAMAIAVGFGVLSLTISIGLILLIRTVVLKPMGALTDYMTRLQDGRYDEAPPYQDRPSELGVMARAIEAFRLAAVERQRGRIEQEGIIQSHQDELLSRAEAIQQHAAERDAIIDNLGEALEQLAVGDLSVRIRQTFPAGFDQLRIDFNASMESLSRVIDSILEATEAVSFGATELSRAAERLSSRTEQQAESVRDSAVTLGQLHKDVAQTTGSAEEVLGVVGNAKLAAERSTGVMTEAMAAMVRIQTSSGHIGQISSVIDEIAFQTNLLALNAGVEAARAGDSGRGFAVVAAEVRALAQRSAKAAKEISQLVRNADAEVKSGVSQVKQTGDVLNEIVGQVVHINELVQHIAVSSRAQTQSITSINTAVQLIDDITRNNAQMVAEATDASQNLAAESNSLTSSISRFKGANNNRRESEGPSPQDAAIADEIDKLFG